MVFIFIIMEQIKRRSWCLKHPVYVDYHDNEWGEPVHEDLRQFEFLVLESAQAGLSWLTILKRREGYLKQKGFRFLGSTIVYAHLQATGLVNDHLMDCFRYRESMN